MTKQRFDKAKNLKMCITAGIGSDHVDLEEACKRKVDVLEVTGSNSVSVAEHEVMSLLALVRNFIPSHDIARNGVSGFTWWMKAAQWHDILHPENEASLAHT